MAAIVIAISAMGARMRVPAARYQNNAIKRGSTFWRTWRMRNPR